VEERVGYELKRAQHALRLAMDEALRGLGLTTPQYAGLAILEEEPGISSAELARRSFVTPQTMAAIVANLERHGLVGRSPHAVHGRILETRLTRRGRSLLVLAHERAREIEARMLAGVDRADRRELVRLLRRCAAALEASEHRATTRAAR
jgi:DNA-binding MarR family transcriptional regulator